MPARRLRKPRGLFVALRKIPIHRSGIRPHLLLGGDREMVLFLGLVSFTLIVVTFQGPAALFGVVLWFVGLFLLRMAGKSDPQLRRVFVRAILWRGHYQARSTPFRVNRFNLSTPFHASPWRQLV